MPIPLLPVQHACCLRLFSSSDCQQESLSRLLLPGPSAKPSGCDTLSYGSAGFQSWSARWCLSGLPCPATPRSPALPGAWALGGSCSCCSRAPSWLQMALDFRSSPALAGFQSCTACCLVPAAGLPAGQLARQAQLVPAYQDSLLHSCRVSSSLPWLSQYIRRSIRERAAEVQKGGQLGVFSDDRVASAALIEGYLKPMRVRTACLGCVRARLLLLYFSKTRWPAEAEPSTSFSEASRPKSCGDMLSITSTPVCQLTLYHCLAGAQLGQGLAVWFQGDVFPEQYGLQQGGCASAIHPWRA